MLKDFGPFGIDQRVGSPHAFIMAAYVGRVIGLLCMLLPVAGLAGMAIENWTSMRWWEAPAFIVAIAPIVVAAGVFFHATYMGLFLDDGDLVVQVGVKRFRVEPSDFQGIQALVVESHTIGGSVDHPGYRVLHDGDKDLRLLAWTVSPILNRFDRCGLEHHAAALEREIESLLVDR